MTAKTERETAYELIRDSRRRGLSALSAIAWMCLSGLLFWVWRELYPRERYRHAKCELAPVAGDCLRPFAKSGDMLLFSRELEAQPGDLVVHSTQVEIRAGFGAPGRTLELLGAKQLKIDGRGRQWLTCADGSFLAHPDHQICGPVVAVWRRPGWRRRVPLEGINFPIAPNPRDGVGARPAPRGAAGIARVVAGP